MAQIHEYSFSHEGRSDEEKAFLYSDLCRRVKSLTTQRLEEDRIVNGLCVPLWQHITASQPASPLRGVVVIDHPGNGFERGTHNSVGVLGSFPGSRSRLALWRSLESCSNIVLLNESRNFSCTFSYLSKMLTLTTKGKVICSFLPLTPCQTLHQGVRLPPDCGLVTVTAQDGRVQTVR